MLTYADRGLDVNGIKYADVILEWTVIKTQILQFFVQDISQAPHTWFSITSKPPWQSPNSNTNSQSNDAMTLQRHVSDPVFTMTKTLTKKGLWPGYTAYSLTLSCSKQWLAMIRAKTSNTTHYTMHGGVITNLWNKKKKIICDHSDTWRNIYMKMQKSIMFVFTHWNINGQFQKILASNSLRKPLVFETPFILWLWNISLRMQRRNAIH